MIASMLLLAVCLTAKETDVVIASDAPRATEIAAEELTNCLSQVFGAPVPVVRAKTPGRKAIVLDGTKGGLGRDAFRIVATSDGVTIEGFDSTAKDPESIIKLPGEQEYGPQFERATLFGAIEFLERFAGCRFYFPGSLGTILPRAGRIEIPEGAFTVRPDFSIRRYGYSDGPVPEELLAEYGGDWKKVKKAEFYRLRMETKYLPCCHGIHKMRLVQRFGKDHPDWFQLRADGTRSLNWQQNKYSGAPCYSSAITNEIYKDIRAYLTGEPVGTRFPKDIVRRWPLCYHDRVIDVMPHDGMTPCRCERCQAAYAREPNKAYYATDLIWGFTAALARRLREDGISDFEITQMSYGPNNSCPSFDLPPEVRVMVAKNGPYSTANRAQFETDRRAIVEWSRRTKGQTWLWGYPGKAGALNIKGPPSLCPRAWGAYYQELAPYIIGAFAESETDHWIFHYLNYYVFAKVCWNNRVDVDALLDEHYRLMFGAAASDLKAIYESLEDKWVRGVAGRVVETELGPLNAPPPEFVIWEQLYSPAEIVRLESVFDAAEKKLASGSAELRRVRFLRKELMGPLHAESDKYQQKLSVIRGMRWKAGDQPMELQPFHYGHRTPPALPTQVTAVRKDGHLIVEYRVTEPLLKQGGVRARADRPNDQSAAFDDNCVEFVLNPSGDRRTFYQFCATSTGAWTDACGEREGKRLAKFDVKWNSGATVGVSETGTGWAARFEIPLAALDDMKPAFPANFARFRNVEGPANASGYYSWNPYLRELRDLDMYATIEP